MKDITRLLCMQFYITKNIHIEKLCIRLTALTPPMSTPLTPDNCRQIHMWRDRGFPPGKPTRRAVATMRSNDLVVGEDHMLGQSCQRYNWQTGRCGSIAFGSSPRRGKTDLKPSLSCGSIYLWNRLQEVTSRKNQEWSP